MLITFPDSIVISRPYFINLGGKFSGHDKKNTVYINIYRYAHKLNYTMALYNCKPIYHRNNKLSTEFKYKMSISELRIKIQRRHNI